MSAASLRIGIIPIVSHTVPHTSSYQNINNLILNLRQSDRNVIAQLQNDLWRYGYYRDGDETGYFGVMTETAIRRFLQAGGQISYSLSPPPNLPFPPGIPQNVPVYSQTFHLLIPIRHSELTQITQQVAALIPNQEIEMYGIENEFGFFIQVGLLSSRDDAEYYRRLLQNRLRLYNISIHSDR